MTGIQGKKVETYDQMKDTPGAWHFRRTRKDKIIEGITFRCPCGRPKCEDIVSLPFRNYVPKPEYPLRDLVTDELEAGKKYGYVKYEEYPPSDSAVVGRFWTQEQLDAKEGPRPSWEWNGNEDKPTLSPSILALQGCKWHGFLRDGFWEDAGDWKRGEKK